MSSEIISFFNIQRKIFGVCEKCSSIFRLSDCKIYTSKKPAEDWLDDIDTELQKLDDMETKIEEKRKENKAKAAALGRREAKKVMKKIDPVFTPMGIDPEDVFGIFHPVDYVVFDGMNSGKENNAIKSIILLDGTKNTPEQKTLQKSIEKAVEKEQYEWVTLRVDEQGKIEGE